MKVVWLFSGGASSMEAAFQDPNHGDLYVSVGAITNRPAEDAPKGYRIAGEGGITPVFIDPSEYGTRGDFHGALTEAAQEMDPHLLCLSGFLKRYSIISEPTISAYRDRIANVHPAPLSIIAYTGDYHPLDVGRNKLDDRKIDLTRDKTDYALEMLGRKGWRRLYTGDDPVFMAALFGEKSTCSVINMVDAGTDTGAVAASSPEKPIDQSKVQRWLDRNAYDRLRDYADRLQGEMKHDCDGPVFRKFLELMATGRMMIDGPKIFVDGQETPYGGYLMGESE